MKISRRPVFRWVLSSTLCSCITAFWMPDAGNLGAAEPDPVPSSQAEPTDEARVAERTRTLERLLSGVTLEGSFTILGSDELPRAERYEIRRVTKQPEPDYWVFHARMRYGDKDVTMPFPLQVKWAGETPVLTVDQLTLPGLGTFNARVVVEDGMYAGTWRHGKVAGQLFGRLLPRDSGGEQKGKP